MRKSYFITIFYLSLTSSILSQNWIWQNPLPQGNPLKNLFVIDSSHAWATGYYGALVYTDDGKNWQLHTGLNTLESLGGIFFISDEIGWLVTQSSDKVYKTKDGGITWNLIASLGFSLVKIYFHDENNGILTGEGYIAKSTDGGFNWDTLLDSSGVTFGHIYFIDSLLGWISTDIGLVFKTEDGGTNWVEQNTGFSSAISDMQFISKDTGWIAIYKYIIKSTDGGNSWTQQYYNNTHSTSSLFFTSSDTGWFFNSAGSLFKTTNSGISWIPINLLYWSVKSFWFDNNYKGWAVDVLGRVMYTSNGGDNWSEQTTGPHFQISGLNFIDSLVGVSTYGGNILRTTNGGYEWEVQFSTGGYGFSDIEFSDTLNGWAAGFCDIYFQCFGGIVLKTTNAGATWINLFPGGYSDVWYFSSVYFLNKYLGFLTGYDGYSEEGRLLKTTNGGFSWENINVGVEAALSDVFFIDSLVGWIVGVQELILKTLDGGETWQILNVGNNDDYENIVFLNRDIGYITSSRGFLIKSTDGGITWFSTGYLGDEMIFADSFNGWVINGTTLLKTTDGGDTWINISIPTNRHLSELAVINRKHIWAAGENGAILKYTDPHVTYIEFDEMNNSPTKFSLVQNYPNPFNPNTKIKFTIPSVTLPQTQSDIFISLKVYDVLGNEIETLINEEKTAGNYEIEFDGSGLTSGIYFYQLKADDFVDTKKMLLLK